MQSKRFLILSCIACLVCFELVQALELRHSVISNGGARVTAGGTTLNGTLGGVVSGRVADVTRSHGIGFWYVIRNHVATDVAETSTPVPQRFELEQNYPNPFNPATTIDFAVPVSGHVTLDVFTVTGKRVGRLINENLAPGYYSVKFFGSELASGTYWYRLTGTGFGDAKKMILLK
jgi:hypothetical protein